MGRSGIRRRRPGPRPPARRPDGHTTNTARTTRPTRPSRTRRALRSPWLPTWLQPLALAAIVLLGRPWAGPFPSDADEHLLLVAAAAVTVPGLVGAVVAGVRTARRNRSAGRQRYQRLLDRAKPQAASSTPDLPPSTPAEVAVSVLGWSFLVAVLDLGLTLVLLALPVDEWWRSLPALPVGVAMVLALLTLLLGIVWLAVAVLGTALRANPDAPLAQVPAATPRDDGRMDPVFRLMLAALAVCLIGLATFGVPGAVLELGYDVQSPWLGSVGIAGPDGPAAVVGWWTALQVTSWMTVGGLVAVVVLSPIAYWRMVAGPRRRTSPGLPRAVPRRRR